MSWFILAKPRRTNWGKWSGIDSSNLPLTIISFCPSENKRLVSIRNYKVKMIKQAIRVKKLNNYDPKNNLNVKRNLIKMTLVNNL